MIACNRFVTWVMGLDFKFSARGFAHESADAPETPAVPGSGSDLSRQRHRSCAMRVHRRSEQNSSRTAFPGPFPARWRYPVPPHHSQNAAELPALEHDLRKHPGTFADLDSGVAEAMVIAQEQEGLVAQLLHHHAASSG